jgi:hypothetical protein
MNSSRSDDCLLLAEKFNLIKSYVGKKFPQIKIEIFQEEKSHESQHYLKSNYLSPCKQSLHSSEKTLNDYLFCSDNQTLEIKNTFLNPEENIQENESQKIQNQERLDIERKKLEEKLANLFGNEKERLQSNRKIVLRNTEPV